MINISKYLIVISLVVFLGSVVVGVGRGVQSTSRSGHLPNHLTTHLPTAKVNTPTPNEKATLESKRGSSQVGNAASSCLPVCSVSGEGNCGKQLCKGEGVTDVGNAECVLAVDIVHSVLCSAGFAVGSVECNAKCNVDCDVGLQRLSAAAAALELPTVEKALFSYIFFVTMPYT